MTETVQVVTQGATTVQIAILFCLGALAFWAIFQTIRWLIRVKTHHLETLPNDLKSLKEKDLKEIAKTLTDMNNSITKMNSKLWSEEAIKDEIQSKIEHHMNKCPAWRFHCTNHGKEEE